MAAAGRRKEQRHPFAFPGDGLSLLPPSAFSSRSASAADHIVEGSAAHPPCREQLSKDIEQLHALSRCGLWGLILFLSPSAVALCLNSSHAGMRRCRHHPTKKPATDLSGRFLFTSQQPSFSTTLMTGIAIAVHGEGRLAVVAGAARFPLLHLGHGDRFASPFGWECAGMAVVALVHA